MTNITIDRKFLEEVVELFDSAITARHPHEILRDIRAALAAPATAPEPVAWLRAGAGLYCGYQTCEVNDENGFPVYRHPPATAPAWHDAQQAEIESLRWTVKDALESLDNGMTADCRATLSSATKETP